jgi:hypothetical protein
MPHLPIRRTSQLKIDVNFKQFAFLIHVSMQTVVIAARHKTKIPSPVRHIGRWIHFVRKFFHDEKSGIKSALRG